MKADALHPASARSMAAEPTEARWRASITALGPRGAAAAAAGHFAIGLRLEDGSTFLAVDRFATQSLCYRVVAGELRHARRADELADSATMIDPQAIFDYLYFHVIPSPRTIYAGIYRLPPGHYALWRDGRLTVEPYWLPTFSPDPRPDFSEHRERFRVLLEQAVRRQLDGSKPACFLSGGTDSSTLAGVIGLVAGRPAATYSIGFEAAGYDEMEYARTASRHFGTEHHEYYVTADDLVRSIEPVAASYDQPFGNSSVLPAYYCALQAKSDGVSRLLAGDGGDELFGGNSRYATQRYFAWYPRVPRILRRGVIEPVFGREALRRVPLLRKAGGYLRYANTPMPDRLQIHNLLNRVPHSEVLGPALLAAVDTSAPVQAQRDVWAHAQAANDIDRELAFDWRYTLAENDLPKVVGSAHLAGLDVGFPLLDDELLDFSMRLPASYKVRGGQLRWFFKEALRGFLPEAIITKKKHGFGLPFGQWMMRHPALHALAADSVRSLAGRGVVLPRFADTLLDVQLASHPAFYGQTVWVLMMLEQWLRARAPNYRIG